MLSICLPATPACSNLLSKSLESLSEFIVEKVLDFFYYAPSNSPVRPYIILKIRPILENWLLLKVSRQ